MPYSGPNDPKLPSYVKKLSEGAQRKWISIFNATYKKDGEKVAFVVANKWLERHIKQKESMHRTENIIERVRFEVDTSQEFLQYTEGGDQYVSFKLADVFVDKYRRRLTKSLLQKWADKINEGYPILGDTDHEFSQRLAKSNLTEEEIKELSKEKPSIAKAVQAVVDNGRLWVKALIDKRYKRLLEKAKGVSLEALVNVGNDGTVLDGNLTGFTFAINQDPVIKETGLSFHG